MPVPVLFPIPPLPTEIPASAIPKLGTPSSWYVLIGSLFLWGAGAVFMVQEDADGGILSRLVFNN